MPHKCPVCNNDDYTELDGYFFCTECQTQSQELIVQEVTASTSEFFSTREVKLAKDSKRSSEKQKPVFGRPWTIYEAYQIIIQSQVDALIKHGASVELKDVVFTIWANYLSKLGVAFCKKEKLVPDIVLETRVGRRRELHRGNLSNPLNRLKRPFTQRKNVKSKVAGNGLDGLNEDFYNEDEPEDQQHDDVIFVDESDDGDIARGNRRLRRTAASRSPEWINLNKTIAVCYIGIMFTNPNILPVDVVRLIYEGKVPYLSVTHLLPPDMIISSKDQSLFVSGRLDTSSFNLEINRLLTYLKLDGMPMADLGVIIPRFIKELCLPGEFAQFCYGLMKKVPFIWLLGRKTCYRKQEVVAASYIILAVKIALGLNDCREIELSKYSKELQKELSPEKKPFVWSDWKNFMIQKSAHEFSAFRTLTSGVSKSRLQHLDQLLECYFNTEPDKRKLPFHMIMRRNKYSVHRYRAEIARSVVKPLEMALERLEYDDEMKQDISCENKQDWTMMGQEFQHCTMSHIVNTELYCRQFGQISPENEARLRRLQEEYSVHKTEVVQYSVVCDTESLMSSRHESYLWLLHLVCQEIDCSALEIDKIVVRLLNCLVDVSNGEAGPVQVCCETGALPRTESVQKKLKQQWYEFQNENN